MIILDNDRLEFRFPEVHERARLSICFQRTLRIPDDREEYPLPPGLGRFPLRHLDDYAARLPQAWRRRGGVMAPIHQAEALWIDFGSGLNRRFAYPFAVKVATGKICALTGDAWADRLNRDPQDYAVVPEQPWLDGYCVAKGIVRQFVAMPLGGGYTLEEQLTGAAEHGGVQIAAWPMKRDRYERLVEARGAVQCNLRLAAPDIMEDAMGLAPGGRMKQDIYDDPYGLDVWDQRHGSRCFVTIANSAQWMTITGERPPTEPPTAKDYTEAGLPWFDYYGNDAAALAGAEKFDSLASVVQVAISKGKAPLPNNETVEVSHVVPLKKTVPRQVREGDAGEWAAA